MNSGQKKTFKAFCQPKIAALQQDLAHTTTLPQKHKAYRIIRQLILDSPLPIGETIVDSHMSDAKGIVKSICKLKSLDYQKPEESEAPLATIVIGFKDPETHSFPEGMNSFSFDDVVNQGNNPKTISYTVQQCNFGLIIGHGPILGRSYWADANRITTGDPKQLAEFADTSCAAFPGKKGKGFDATKYQAAARMQLICTKGETTSVFSVVTIGQNTNAATTDIGNDYHGEAYIYGGFLAILNILDLSEFDSVGVHIDYAAGTDYSQKRACGICALLIKNTMHPAMTEVPGVTRLSDSYF